METLAELGTVVIPVGPAVLLKHDLDILDMLTPVDTSFASLLPCVSATWIISGWLLPLSPPCLFSCLWASCWARSLFLAAFRSFLFRPVGKNRVYEEKISIAANVSQKGTNTYIHTKMYQKRYLAYTAFRKLSQNDFSRQFCFSLYKAGEISFSSYPIVFFFWGKGNVPLEVQRWPRLCWHKYKPS